MFLARPLLRPLAAAALCAAGLAPALAAAAPKTVCTITVNSPNEKEVFRSRLPAGDYRFVELVERGRKDWLASACEQKVQCDALIISGHFDGGEEFYTDRYDVEESLSVEEMQRASCSESCPGVFSHLKEVYLFGCNTLKPEPRQAASGEIVRALLRAGQTPADAARVAALIGEQHGRSNRDRMRHIFKDVPVIYGFSSKAPLGRYAGPLLDRYFQATPAAEVGTGQVSPKLLSLFAPSSMTVTSGLRASEPQASARRDACNFVDDRLSPTQKVAFLHELLRRDVTEVRMFLDDMERFAGGFSPAQRVEPKTAAAFAAIAADQASRDRFLAFARDTDDASVGARMMALARRLGWLSPQQEQAEFLQMLAQRMDRGSLGLDEMNLACARGAAGRNEAPEPLVRNALKFGKIAPAAAMACLGSTQARERVLRGVSSADPEEIAIAQGYLRHQPLANAGEVRAVATAIGRMPPSAAQVRALETLAQQRLSDPDSLREISAMFAAAKSLQTQRAIAQILIRADHRVLGRVELARTLKQHRLKSPDGEDVIDALIRVLQAG